MNNIAIYTLTSELHDTQAVSAATQEFLGSLNISYDFRDNDMYAQEEPSLHSCDCCQCC